jgi:hypothetical protein
MTERISTLDVRQRLGDMLNRVALRHDEFVIERKGKALAALDQQKGGGLTDGKAAELAAAARGWARKAGKKK